MCFVEENSNLKLHSISDIVGDHTEIHLLLKVLYQYLAIFCLLLINYVLINNKHFYEDYYLSVKILKINKNIFTRVEV